MREMRERSRPARSGHRSSSPIGSRQPQRDRHNHRPEIAEGPDPGIGADDPAKIISSHALTKKAGPTATILKKSSTGLTS
jgi:hypothetical protein